MLWILSMPPAWHGVRTVAASQSVVGRRTRREFGMRGQATNFSHLRDTQVEFTLCHGAPTESGSQQAVMTIRQLCGTPKTGESCDPFPTTTRSIALRGA